MFGEQVDYRILRALTHDRNRKTREEIEQDHSFTLDEADAYLKRVREEFFQGQVPLDPSLSYLDIGCGMGRLSLGLARAGLPNVTGVDIVPHSITKAQRLAEQLPESTRPTFVHADIHDWEPGQRYDVIFVLGAMEHIHDQDRFLVAMARLLAPGRQAFVSIEPFHSPLGDHMRGFFRVPVPWSGLLFNEQAMLKVRTERFRPYDPVTRYEDIEGGLNQIRYKKYLENVSAAGLRFTANHINPQLRKRRRTRPLHAVSRALTAVPGVRDYFIVCDYGILEHDPSAGADTGG